MLNYKFRNAPLQQISRIVEKPESVFWFDEVWPGFDGHGQRMMIENYLDGVHLKKLALNNGQGYVIVYQATIEDYRPSQALIPARNQTQRLINEITSEMGRVKKRKGNLEELLKKQKVLYLKRGLYAQQLKKDISQIIRRAQSYRLSEFLSQHAHEFNYKVTMQRQHLPEWQEEYAWADKITIYDVSKNEVIGYSKRGLGINTTEFFWFWDVKDIIPHFRKYYDGIGDFMAYRFDDKVLFEYAYKKGKGVGTGRTYNFNPTIN